VFCVVCVHVCACVYMCVCVVCVCVCDAYLSPIPKLRDPNTHTSERTHTHMSTHVLQEYSICAQVYRLTSVDLCEIARNSVYHRCVRV